MGLNEPPVMRYLVGFNRTSAHLGVDLVNRDPSVLPLEWMGRALAAVAMVESAMAPVMARVVGMDHLRVLQTIFHSLRCYTQRAREIHGVEFLIDVFDDGALVDHFDSREPAS